MIAYNLKLNDFKSLLFHFVLNKKSGIVKETDGHRNLYSRDILVLKIYLILLYVTLILRKRLLACALPLASFHLNESFHTEVFWLSMARIAESQLCSSLSLLQVLAWGLWPSVSVATALEGSTFGPWRHDVPNHVLHISKLYSYL